MVGEYISRDYLLDEYDRQHQGPPGGARKIIAEAPAADVVEVRHGRWMNERQEGLSSFSAECDLCGKRTLAYFHYFYCPNCGAKMDGGQDDV